MHAIANATVEESWAVVEQFTTAIRDAAQLREWQQVLDLAGSRHQRLLNHFQQFPVGPDNAVFYQTRLSDMLGGERDLQRLATDARREVMREGLLTNQNYRAVNAYLSN